MTHHPSQPEVQRLYRELTHLPPYTEWVAFGNRMDREEALQEDALGAVIAALANSAALHEREAGYLVLPKGDADGNGRTNVCSDDLTTVLSRLAHRLKPLPDLQVYDVMASFETAGQPVRLVRIAPATGVPTVFDRFERIRIGSETHLLLDHPEAERELWQSLDTEPLEARAATRVSAEEVFSLLSEPTYRALRSVEASTNTATREALLDAMIADRMLVLESDGRYTITELGAALLAKKLSLFPTLKRKALRVIRYAGKNRLEAAGDFALDQGYAVDFDKVLPFIRSLFPHTGTLKENDNERLNDDAPYPDVLLRELLLNILAHQNFRITGSGPTVEIFDDRIEFLSYGRPLVDPLRFLDRPARRRNEALTLWLGKLRKLVTDEGVDHGAQHDVDPGVDPKSEVVADTAEQPAAQPDAVSLDETADVVPPRGLHVAAEAGEALRLPAPFFRKYEQSLRVILPAHVPGKLLGQEDATAVCYYHCVLRYLDGEFMTVASLRERLGLTPAKTASAQRIVRAAVTQGLIRPLDETSEKPGNARRKRYVPYWA